MKCLYCGKEFEISPFGSGGNNRVFCYECYPEGLDRKQRNRHRGFLFSEIIKREKLERGCDICGYKKSSSALEWHHPNQDKEYTPSAITFNLDLYHSETQKCQLLCANCHREIHEKNREPYVWPTSSKEVVQVTEEQIIDSYQKVKSCREVAKIFGVDASTVSKICKKNSIPIEANYNSKVKIAKIDKNTGEVIQNFDSISDALKSIGKENTTTGHIAAVCKGKRNSAYGYKWKYI